MDAPVRVTDECTIDPAELTWTATTSRGPGGQHANRARTRVEVRFDVAGSPSLTEEQRARLLERVGPSIVAAAEDERSQARNRSLARDRLVAKLAGALAVDPPRRPTRPGPSARRRRIDAKRRRGELKRGRRPPEPEG